MGECASEPGRAMAMQAGMAKGVCVINKQCNLLHLWKYTERTGAR